MNTSSIALSLLLGSLPVNLSAQVILGVGVDAAIEETNYGTASSYTSWSDLGVGGSNTSHTSDPIAASVDGIDFTFTITVTAAGPNAGTNLGIRSPNSLLGKVGNQDFANGDQYTITIGSIVESDPGFDVVFDGFTRFSTGNSATNEGATVNGVTYLRGGGVPVWDLTGGPLPAFTATSAGTSTGRFVDFQFSKEAAPTSPLRLTITPNADNPGNYDFSWTSRAGMVYDLVSDTGLASAPAGWSPWNGNVGIPSGGTTTTLENVPGGGDPKRFFAVVEKDPE